MKSFITSGPGQLSRDCLESSNFACGHLCDIFPESEQEIH